MNGYGYDNGVMEWNGFALHFSDGIDVDEMEGG